MKSLTSYISVNNLIRILIRKFYSCIILDLRSIHLVVICGKIESIIYERCTPSSEFASWSCGCSLLFFFLLLLLIECAFKSFLDTTECFAEEAHNTSFFFFLFFFVLVVILIIILIYLLIIFVVIVLVLIIDISILLLFNTNSRIRLLLMLID